ncbi:MAG: hypothetical protein NDF53_03630 [archaeon GB-1867-097]|nr:hypothetical protein [Candidatus Culexmicrobium thermophilum]
MIGGYADKILRVAFSNEKISEEPLNFSLVRSLIDCLGIASKIMLEELDPNMKPFDPRNKLILVTGSLTGSHCTHCE